jgi:uncharacterized protein (DUF2249 family)
MNPSTPPSDSTPALAADAVFDVRPIPSRVKHFQIFQRWTDLPVGQYFILLNDHDPVPLRYQFEAEYSGAFLWKYLERGPEEYRVKITKLKAITVASHPGHPTQPVATAPTVIGGVQQIDVCGLEPPEPLIRILDALESLPTGISLRAHTDREPCHLFGEAEQRGFLHNSKEEPDGSWITVLTRA